MLKNKKIELLLAHLADRLRNHGGKMQYGYLKADLKNVVDEIVDELARDGRVAVAYHAWKEAKGLIDSIYSDSPSADQILQEESSVPDLDFPDTLTADYDIPVPNDILKSLSVWATPLPVTSLRKLSSPMSTPNPMKWKRNWDCSASSTAL